MKSTSILRQMFSSKDPIKDYENKQESFFKSMKELKVSERSVDYSVSSKSEDKDTTKKCR